MSLRPLLPLAALVCMACAGAAAARQEPCRLERAVAPDYGGVMLGMSLEELARIFPGSEDLQRGPGAGAARGEPFVASLGMLELGVKREEFRGAAELLLTFLEGRLRRIDVRYRQPVPWAGLAEFSAHTSKRLAVPADAWGAPSSDAERQSRPLDCRCFSVVVSIDRNGASTLSIVDTAAGPKEDAAGAQPADAPAKMPLKTRPRKRGQGGASGRPARGADGKEKRVEKESR